VGQFPRKTSLTLLLFGVLMLILNYRKVAVSPTVPEPMKTTARLENPIDPGVAPKAPGHGGHRTTPPSGSQLSDPTDALEPFFKALQRTEAGQGITRILHYGDSPVTADSITADMRSLLQERFGDAGHGFVLISKPWAWYGHRGVDMKSGGWHAQPASQGDRAKDNQHGLGGVSLIGSAGAYSIIRLTNAHERIEISYYRQPSGGTFTVRSGEELLATINTEAAESKADWSSLALPADAHEVRIEVQTGTVRLFGLSFEKGTRGVIYNSLGLNGGQVQVVLRYFQAAHWAEQLQHQRPDLVVVNYGTNESVYPKYLDTFYPGELREVIRRIKTAVPEASVLIMSPMDRGERIAGGEIVTIPAVPHIVEIQRQVAAETGCAFFNTYQAMGGEGTMARWYVSTPQLVTADFMHPFPAGARKVGVLFDNALTDAYDRYKAAHKAMISARSAITVGTVN
jgi:lysophospholipase L1-like esterase